MPTSPLLRHFSVICHLIVCGLCHTCPDSVCRHIGIASLKRHPSNSLQNRACIYRLFTARRHTNRCRCYKAAAIMTACFLSPVCLQLEGGNAIYRSRKPGQLQWRRQLPAGFSNRGLVINCLASATWRTWKRRTRLSE